MTESRGSSATTPEQLGSDHANDPDLNRPPRAKLLSIDWSTVHVDTDAGALAVWQQIAPTGTDWEQRLEEVPADVAHPLAVAMLHAGNFTCARPRAATDCSRAPQDVPDPSETATLTDPCLRRMLALWSFDQVDATDVPKLHDALRAIVTIPPPESQLVAAALHAVPDTDQAGRYELLALAWKAGQRDLVNGTLGDFDEPHLADLVLKLHVDGALEILSVENQRPVYLKAVADEQLQPATRKQAIVELVTAGNADAKLAPDVRAVLVAATRSPACEVAAAAAAQLHAHGESAFVPKKPVGANVTTLMRSLCVLASYETLQRADEASLLPTYLPNRGLELVRVVYDPYNAVDTDGDGDPHTERTTDLVARDAAALPELDDLVVAMHHCTGTTCRSDDHEFRFKFLATGTLSRLEVIDRPPCSQ